MADNNPKRESGRVALTKSQAAEGLGLELVELSQKWLADGKFEAHELKELEAWLRKVPPDSLPAIRFLKEEMEHCLADGEIADWKLYRLQAALIRVIPVKERQQAKAARSEVIRIAHEKHAPEREAARRAAIERSHAMRKKYAAIWAKEAPTEAQIDFINELGGILPASASKLDASDMIDHLLGREVEPLRENSGCLIFILIVTVIGALVWAARYYTNTL